MYPIRSLSKTLGCSLTQKFLKNELKHSSRILSWRNYSSEKNYVESPFGSVDIPKITIQELIFKDVGKWTDHTALVCGMSGRTYTYETLQVLSKKVAAGFLKSGLKPGQVVALVLPNLPEFMIALLGALQAGLVVSSINPLYGPSEILHQVTNSESACIITYPAKIADVQEALAKINGPKPILSAIHQPTDPLPDGVRSFMELLMVDDTEEEAVEKIKVNHDDLALLLYSSGTTGLPKGVRLTHRNIVANCTQINRPEIKLITLIHVVPPLVQYLANHPSVTSKHLATVRAAINGAAAVSQTDVKKLKDKKDMIVMSGYGLTESSPVITCARNTTTDSLTVGHVVSNSQVKLIDTETGEIVDPSKPGEICCRGPQIMQGYHKNEKATAETVKDGWLHTGDVGYFDKEGQLFIVDRIKELIKVKGFQVAPLELEHILKEHPGVGDVGVVGKPDKRFGEVPVAFIVKTPQSKVTEKELQEFVASKVAEYKQISSVIFLDSIPKNTTGKILRKDLKKNLK